MAAKIKKGDIVVLTGRDKGKTGEVVQMLPKEERAVVRGVNLVKRHQRQTAAQRAASSRKRRASTCRTWPTRTRRTASRPAGFKVLEDGRKVRFAKRSGGPDRWLRPSWTATCRG